MCGLLGSELALTASVALSDDAVVGLNLTAIVHEALPASVAPQVPPVIVKSAALMPLTALPIDSVYGDLLATFALSVLDDVRDTVP